MGVALSLIMSLWRWGRLAMVKHQSRMAVPDSELFKISQMRHSGSSVLPSQLTIETKLNFLYPYILMHSLRLAILNWFPMLHL
jgi:hypothetical protein